MNEKISFLLCTLILFAGSCTPKIPKDALQLRPESMALRQLQTRRYNTRNEKKLLVAAASLLQDLGFTIDESETHLGVIVGSKQRSAVEGSQIAGAVALALLGVETPIDKEQKIRASVVTRPVGKKSVNLRITFQRMVWDTNNEVSKVESLEDPKMYQEFFAKLSKAVFLEAHEI